MSFEEQLQNKFGKHKTEEVIVYIYSFQKNIINRLKS